MKDIIAEVELLAIRDDNYCIYVFQEVNTKEFILCTRLPNWQVPKIDISEKGYLHYQIIKAGDSYYDPNTQETIQYRYSNVYFINFVKKSDFVKNKEIIL